MTSDFSLLSLIIFLPTLGAFFLLFFSKQAEEAMRYFTLMVTVLTFALTLALLGRFNSADPGIQPVSEAVIAAANGGPVDPLHEARGVSVEWIKSWNIWLPAGSTTVSACRWSC
jgi:hypothetical protein